MHKFLYENFTKNMYLKMRVIHTKDYPFTEDNHHNDSVEGYDLRVADSRIFWNYIHQR